MNEAFIISGARTPVGKFGGSFKDISAPTLGSIVIKTALQKANITSDLIDEVIMGNAMQSAEAGYAARLSALLAGVPQNIPTISINRQCSSGLEAINIGAQMIKAGEASIIVAGGTENMSQTPYLLGYKARFDGLRMGDSTLVDGLTEGLGCPVNRYPMGVTAENIAERFQISRSDQDELAVLSHSRALTAIKDGRFDSQITEVLVPQRRSDPRKVAVDESPRGGTTIDSLSTLPPAFKKNGTVTAGNASSINDGAAAVVMMSSDKIAELEISPRLKWVSRGVAGVDPAIMGIGPIPATQKALGKAGLTIKDIDVVELNEAFAAQALHCIRELNLDVEKTNVNGSGISLGHPVGATGAIMTVKLMEELERSNGTIGLATMCVGGGQGVASIFERVN